MADSLLVLEDARVTGLLEHGNSKSEASTVSRILSRRLSRISWSRHFAGAPTDALFPFMSLRCLMIGLGDPVGRSFRSVSTGWIGGVVRIGTGCPYTQLRKTGVIGRVGGYAEAQWSRL